MVKAEGVIPYLTKISQVRDELAVVGEVVPSADNFEWGFKALGCVCGGFGS